MQRPPSRFYILQLDLKLTSSLTTPLKPLCILQNLFSYLLLHDGNCALSSLNEIKSKIKPDRSRSSIQTPVHLSVSISQLAAFSQTVTQPPGARPHVNSTPGIRPSTNMQFHQSVLTAFMSTTQNQSLPSPSASIWVVKIQYSGRELSQVMKGNRGDRRGFGPASKARQISVTAYCKLQTKHRGMELPGLRLCLWLCLT